MTKVLILGASGMLGQAVINEFRNFDGQVIATTRKGGISTFGESIEVRNFDAETDDVAKIAHDLGPDDFIINCIGIVKAKIRNQDWSDVQRALEINALFPHKIQNFASKSGTKVIQIATDCVFSGSRGSYIESDLHDATDIYGKTKSLGEVSSSQFMHIRVSIIGPEISGHTSLYDWVRFQPRGAEINGYINHMWNGIPATHFSRACLKIVLLGMFEQGVHHLIPADKTSKCELVRLIASHLNRDDLVISEFLHVDTIDRSLSTNDKNFSNKIWKLIGFQEVPSIKQLIGEMN